MGVIIDSIMKQAISIIIGLATFASALVPEVSKTFQKCDLANQLLASGYSSFTKSNIGDWICLTYYESSWKTSSREAPTTTVATITVSSKSTITTGATPAHHPVSRSTTIVTLIAQTCSMTASQTTKSALRPFTIDTDSTLGMAGLTTVRARTTAIGFRTVIFKINLCDQFEGFRILGFF